MLFGQSSPVKYSRVKVHLYKTHISELAELGLEYDHGVIAKGKYWVNDVSARELALIKENNFSYEILVDDVQAWYVEQNKLPIEEIKSVQKNSQACGPSEALSLYETPKNYKYGSMGGYLTYDELLLELDSMKIKFPNLVSERQPIGDHLTQEGRPIYWLKIGNNPNENEDKPAIFYNALHHAREANALSQLVFYMWYLLENYETDAEIKYIMDQVEMYFVPCVNPDGYIYNESINPEGGGLWRKNRSIGTGSAIGVDLNRNYGYEWGIDDSGSASNPNFDTYRGTAPFSEPETKAIRDFCEEHQFNIALNYHSYSNLLIIPWGFNNTLTPDDDTYRAFGNKMTEQNNYLIGTGLETVGYLVNGDSDDWMYGEQETKPKIYSFTPEVGPETYGFWPPISAIDGLNKDNLWQNISAAGLLKPYGEVIDLNPNALTAKEGTLSFNVQNIGLETGDFTVTVQTENSDLAIISEPQTISLAHLDTSNFSIDYTILDSGKRSTLFKFDITIDNGLIERNITISKPYFEFPFEAIFLETVDSALTNWNSTDGWASTPQVFYSEDYSITDSPNRNYPDNSSLAIDSKAPVDLTNAKAAMLKFRGRWALESGYDYVQVLISTDQVNFTPLCGNHSVVNSMGRPAYNGFQDNWVLEEIDISSYIGQSVFFRFQLDSDAFVNEDGFYFDDFAVEIIPQETSTALIEPIAFVKNTIQVIPNPFSEDLSIAFTLKEKVSELTLRLVNTLGQEMAVKQLEQLSVGEHSFNWNGLDVDDGFYFLQLQTAKNQMLTQKINKVSVR